MAASACREERGLNQGHAEAAVDVWGLTVLAMSSSSLGGGFSTPGEECDYGGPQNPREG